MIYKKFSGKESTLITLSKFLGSMCVDQSPDIKKV